MHSDPIADMLTRLRNACTAGHTEVTMPSSKMKNAIAEVLKSEGFITDYSVTEIGTNIKEMTVTLKYVDGESVIEGCKRVSKPSCRIYCGSEDIPHVRGGMGIAILSTSTGVISDRKARKINVGGEVLCQVW
ncbi:MAG: 30S ribosomal protein S8 [Lentisphaeria bacterium]